jgi:hypothetical protein
MINNYVSCNSIEYLGSPLRRGLQPYAASPLLVNDVLTPSDIDRNQKFEKYLLNQYSSLGYGGIVFLHTLRFILIDSWPAVGPVTEMISLNVRRFRPQKFMRIALCY